MLIKLAAVGTVFGTVVPRGMLPRWQRLQAPRHAREDRHGELLAPVSVSAT